MDINETLYRIRILRRNNMINWKKMYAILCGGISDALDVLPEGADNSRAIDLLHAALEEAEEIYLSADGEE